MSETLTIVCDSCGSRIGKASRTKIRFAREPYRVEPTDLCPDCAHLVLVAIGKAPAPAAPTARTRKAGRTAAAL